MNWAEALQHTIDLWEGIRSSVGRATEIELLTEINAVCDLCARARDDARPREDPCLYCLAYQQFGGCRQVSLQMSELVVQGRWDELREAIDGFVSKLESIETLEEVHSRDSATRSGCSGPPGS